MALTLGVVHGEGVVDIVGVLLVFGDSPWDESALYLSIRKQRNGT